MTTAAVPPKGNAQADSQFQSVTTLVDSGQTGTDTNAGSEAQADRRFEAPADVAVTAATPDNGFQRKQSATVQLPERREILGSQVPDSLEASTEQPVDAATSIAMPDLDEYVRRHFLYAKQTAASYLLWTENVYEAKTKLHPADFRQFCERVGLDPDVKGTISRITTTGQHAPTLLNHVNQLPPHENTLYKIAHLKQPQMMAVLQSDRLNPKSTAKDIDAILGKMPGRPVDHNIGLATDEAAKKECRRILLDGTEMTDSDFGLVDREVSDLEARFGKSLKVTRTGIARKEDPLSGFKIETPASITEARQNVERSDA